MKEHLYDHLLFLYGPDQARLAYLRLEEKLAGYGSRLTRPATRSSFSPHDAVLITYGDMVQDDQRPPLRVLSDFLVAHLVDVVNTVHILPFYPYSSDDGFSVIDYQAVDPDLGDWEDIRALGGHFRLMFDAVINHISAHSEWFGRFLAGDPAYQEYFTVIEEGVDLSAVFRPRALPLLTPIKTVVGRKLVWTTFSDDQIDLNYANPQVLLEVIEILLFYVSQGAELIRLDAIAFLWKEPGTNCLHLPQTHRVIQLLRSVLDLVAPHVSLITETNVPHDENIAYFGDGHNEAQMVYNFSLPPLTLHAFHSGDARTLSRWAAGLTLPSDEVTFFNFLASHDGVGLTPARDILSAEQVEAMAQRVQAAGGLVSYRSLGDGRQVAYELNVNYLDALAEPGVNESDDLRARRFLASQAVMLALRGVPGIYFHSLFGSRGWLEGVQQTGRNRTINRQKLLRSQLEQSLGIGLRRQVFTGYCHLLRARANQIAFHPNGEQEILDLHPSIFALLRSHGGQTVVCLQNVSNRRCELVLPWAGTTDLLSGQLLTGRQVGLAPFDVMWMKKK